MLTDKIRLSGPDTNEPEDILSSSLAVIFPDDITNQHGDASNSVIYMSPRFGDINLSLADPKKGDTVSLFSHFLWNAGLLLGEFIEEGDCEREVGGGVGVGVGVGVAGETWRVEGMKVLEFGAGTGLAGIMAGLMVGREGEVVITDYPAEEILENIKVNVASNIDSRRGKPGGENLGVVRVEGHEWGKLEGGFEVAGKGTFDRILVADCLWMPWQHGNLLKSIGWFLSGEGRAWVVAGFHTGRVKMRGFFTEEGLEKEGLELERIWERNAEGREREWVFDRGIEDVTERKRWLVIAILRRRK